MGAVRPVGWLRMTGEVASWPGREKGRKSKPHSTRKPERMIGFNQGEDAMSMPRLRESRDLVKSEAGNPESWSGLTARSGIHFADRASIRLCEFRSQKARNSWLHGF